MEIDLFTRSDEFVTRVRILPYQIMPQGICWGTRFFFLSPDGKYREGLCHLVVDPSTPKAEFKHETRS